jgi:sulfatase modifying factor 1
MRSMITRGMGHFTNRTGLCVALAAALALAGCSSSGEPAPDEAAARPDPTGPPIEGMVLVRGGVYAIGSEDGETDERPARRILLDPFYLDAREVTNAEFARFVEATGYRAEGEWKLFAGAGRERHPVVSVTWRDAAAFAAWAGKRLPTEAEWEAAARGGLEGKPYPNGDALAAEDATFEVEDDGSGARTTPAGSHRPNGYGLYDMAGNVWEWCADRYVEDAYARPPLHNPTGPERGASRVMRGGAWNSRPSDCRVSNRLEMTPTLLGPVFGFRCAKTPE